MIQRIKVRAFKSLDDVDVELGKVNVFIGANGSGKSNFLEAIGVLSSAASGRVDDDALLRRGVRPGVPALYKSSFKGSRMRSAVRFDAWGHDSRFAVELINPLDDPSPAWRYKTELFEEDDVELVGRSPANAAYLNMNPEAGLVALKSVEFSEGGNAKTFFDVVHGYRIYSPTTAALRGLVKEPSMAPVGLSGVRLPEAVSELLALRNSDERCKEICSEVFELIDWISLYGARPAENVPLSPSASASRTALVFRDRFMAKGRDLLTAYDASEGALYILMAAVLAVHPLAPSVFAIDNVDHGLNPRLARALMKFLSSWVVSGPDKKQVLMTTHNPLSLDGLPLQDDNVRLFTVDRSQSGRTVITRVQVNKKLLAKAQEGWTLSRLWVMGHLGGVPDV